MTTRAFAAVDLGAESGRVLLGRFDGTRVDMECVSRFRSESFSLPDGQHWNLPSIFTNVLKGLASAASASGGLQGVGIDTWGVDYALLDDSGRTLGLPFHYRDGRTDAAILESTFSLVSRHELYARTGIQMMPINTIFQLMAEPRTPFFETASRIALIPDLLGLWLTGELANESTVASTTGLLNAGKTAVWATDVIERLGLPVAPFAGALVEPGAKLGAVLPAHAGSAGAAVGATVWVVGGHDTASAFASVPSSRPDHAVISSGTWSLVGTEIDEPQLGPLSAAFNLTNERGVDGRTRLLRNVMGLWLLQECRREWALAGQALDYQTLQELAAGAVGVVPLFDPDDHRLLRGEGMPQRIAAACVANEQPAPDSLGMVAKSIFVSLACKYRCVLERLEAATGRCFSAINIVGGGVRNALLCQLTADITGLPLIIGPEEATGLGNVLVQVRAAGEVSSLSEMQELAAQSCLLREVNPTRGARDDQTYERFLAVTGLATPLPANLAV